MQNIDYGIEERRCLLEELFLVKSIVILAVSFESVTGVNIQLCAACHVRQQTNQS